MSIFDQLLRDFLSEEAINELAGIKVSDSTSMENIRMPLNSLRKALEKCANADEYIMGTTRRDINEQVQQLIQLLTDLKTKDLGTLQNISTYFQQTSDQIMIRIERLINLSGQFAGLGAEVDLSEIAEFRQEADKTLANYRIMSDIASNKASSTISSEVWSHFDTKAAEYNELAKRNRTVLIYLLITTFLCGPFYFWCFDIQQSDNTQTFLEIFPLLNLLTVLWFAIRAASRNMRSYQHMAALNENKSVVVRSGDVYINTTGNPETQAEIRTVVVGNVFSIPDTGFLAHEKESSMIGNTGLLGWIKGISSR